MSAAALLPKGVLGVHRKDNITQLLQRWHSTAYTCLAILTIILKENFAKYPGWPETLDPFASASRVLELQECVWLILINMHSLSPAMCHTCHPKQFTHHSLTSTIPVNLPPAAQLRVGGKVSPAFLFYTQGSYERGFISTLLSSSQSKLNIFSIFQKYFLTLRNDSKYEGNWG